MGPESWRKALLFSFHFRFLLLISVELMVGALAAILGQEVSLRMDATY
jgi:hypothetical protein